MFVVWHGNLGGVVTVAVAVAFLLCDFLLQPVQTLIHRIGAYFPTALLLVSSFLLISLL